MGLRQSCWNCRLLEGGENRSSRSDRDVERSFAGGRSGSQLQLLEMLLYLRRGGSQTDLLELVCAGGEVDLR